MLAIYLFLSTSRQSIAKQSQPAPGPHAAAYAGPSMQHAGDSGSGSAGRPAKVSQFSKVKLVAVAVACRSGRAACWYRV